ncbi:hypothetical protein HF086_008610 [Spodoptera exigua]|uniref:THAP-type domain-containing protein n=1 Tax=Spodoptera exigua TaxID=7107 RepID=A0A922S937_SPOEX|nr:hypothetical protein HF086_008610 [Spodoptera exigua]
MVNYCCVYGCGRNSKTSKHLYYYGLPKERNRLLQWLEAIGRTDLLERDHKKLTHRVCSRHFTPSNIKNKHLCADAVPTLCLSNCKNEDCSSDDDVPITKYVKNYDSGIELTEEEKSKIRNEVTRVLNIKQSSTEDSAKGKQKALKRKLPQKKRRDKEFKELVEICVGAEEMASVTAVPEVFFADVNDIRVNQNLDVKEEITNTLTPLATETDSQIDNSIKLNDELSEFLIGVKYTGP